MKLIDSTDENGEKIVVAQMRNGEIFLKDSKSKTQLSSWKVPYGAVVHCKNKQKVKVGELLFLGIRILMLF